jgi:hypothetical protein
MLCIEIIIKIQIMENKQLIIEAASMLVALKQDNVPRVNECNIANQTSNNINKTVLYFEQQRLILLRHASLCKNDEHCTSPHCVFMKSLWTHVKICKTKGCTHIYCKSSLLVLSHFAKCKDPSCQICDPVRQLICTNADIGTQQTNNTISNQSSGVSSNSEVINKVYNTYQGKIWKAVRIVMKYRIKELSFTDREVEIIEKELYLNAKTLNSYKDQETLLERITKITIQPEYLLNKS